MTPHAKPPRRQALLHWLGLGLPPEDHVEPSGEGEDDHQDRRQALAAITDFMLDHRLDPSGATLGAVHELTSGSNPALTEAVAQRIASSAPVTEEWLERIAGDRTWDRAGDGDAAQDMQGVQQLLSRLESTIDAFARTTSSARSATARYGDALEQHAGSLDDEAGADVATRITTIVRDMLARTRALEGELDRSARETHDLEEQLADARREAEIDFLTGLPNRRAFEGVFAREVALAAAANEPISVAFCDIDHFKRINDEHGHEAGDRILKLVAEALSALADDRCYIARHGGEEFVAVARGRSIEEVFATFEQARQGMAARRLVNRSTELPFGPVTFSVGLAEVRAYSQAGDALRAADQALYEAKKAGRNRVVTARHRNR